MQAVNTPAFEGRVVFHTRHLSLRSQARADAILSAAKVACPEFFPQYERGIEEAALLVVATEAMEFHFTGDENAMLLELREFWAALQKAQGGKGDTLPAQAILITNWHMDTHRLIRAAWIEAVNSSHVAYRDPVRLPRSMLTPEELEALVDPDHPLASPGSSSDDASGSGSTDG